MFGDSRVHIGIETTAILSDPSSYSHKCPIYDQRPARVTIANTPISNALDTQRIRVNARLVALWHSVPALFVRQRFKLKELQNIWRWSINNLAAPSTGHSNLTRAHNRRSQRNGLDERVELDRFPRPQEANVIVRLIVQILFMANHQGDLVRVCIPQIQWPSFDNETVGHARDNAMGSRENPVLVKDGSTTGVGIIVLNGDLVGKLSRSCCLPANDSWCWGGNYINHGKWGNFYFRTHLEWNCPGRSAKKIWMKNKVEESSFFGRKLYFNGNFEELSQSLA